MSVVFCPFCATAFSHPGLASEPAPPCPKCGALGGAPANAAEPLPIPPDESPLEPLPLPEHEDHFETDPVPGRRPAENPLTDFLAFRVMILPVIVQVVFWVGSLASVGQGLKLVAAGLEPDAGAAEPAPRDGERAPNGADKRPVPPSSFSHYVLASGLALMVLGPLLVRLACELIVVVFRIYDELKYANDRHRYRLPGPA